MGAIRFKKWFGININVMLVVVVLATLVGEGWPRQQQQQEDTTAAAGCVNPQQQLAPCLNYLNNGHGSGEPPESCCDPLKRVIKSNPECLCSMISMKGTNEAEQAGINVTEAQQLPARCGQHVNPISCLSATAGSPVNSAPRSATFSISFQSATLVAAFLSIIFRAV